MTESEHTLKRELLQARIEIAKLIVQNSGLRGTLANIASQQAQADIKTFSDELAALGEKWIPQQPKKVTK